MLYVFHVDRGHLISFDMELSIDLLKELASNRFERLKELIRDISGIPPVKQVLMMSGGCCLENNSLRVNDFGTGTESSNPIYLFSNEILENVDILTSMPIRPPEKPKPEVDLLPELEAAMAMPPSYETVCYRVQLAQRFYEESQTIYKECEGFVRDQHQQQQGWAAVSANLDDLLRDFQRKSDAFSKMHRLLQEKIGRHRKYLEKFSYNLELLNRIPVIPVLLNTPAENKSAINPEVLKLCEVVTDEETQTAMNQTQQQHSSGESSEDEESDQQPRAISLLQWISMKDTQCTLDQVAYDCNGLIDELSEKCIEQWKAEKELALNYIQKYPRKNISGLSSRLFGLSQIIERAMQLVNEQADLARSFVQNQNRASNLGDVTILPDLCLSHQRQLSVMLKNYNDICEYKNRCYKAKEELCINIHRRLQSVLKGEQLLLECDYKLTTFSSKQKHLDYLLGVLNQIEHAPQMYLNAVVEVVRRRHFSQAFLTWASDLACHLTAIHNEELTRRTDFQAEFEQHFLNSLFPGLNDLPPAYGTDPPPLFDIALPKLTLADIEMLREKIPEIANQQKIPDFAGITQFFQSKSITGVKFEERGVGDDRCIEDRLVQAVTDVGLGSITDRALLISGNSCQLAHPHFKDFDRGFESETDTEEFEKVGQSPIDTERRSAVSRTDAATLTEDPQEPDHSLSLGHQATEFVTTEYYIDESMPSSLSTDGGGSSMLPPAELMRQLDDSNNVVALLQDNLSTSKEEIAELKQALQKSYEFLKFATSLFRSDMSSIKSDLISEKTHLADHCANISKVLSEFQEGMEIGECEKIQRLTVDHELELIDLKNLAIAKDDEIRSLKLEKIESECVYNKRLEDVSAKFNESELKLKQYLLKCEELGKNLEERQIEHELHIQEVQQQMQREHQNELESLRSRFRLMTVTNMERSPSDTSLEHVERLDVIELVNHESILAEIKELHAQEKEKVVAEALKRAEEAYNLELEVHKTKFDEERNIFMLDAVKKVREEKDKQIELLLQREEALTRESRKYRDVIQQLTFDEEDRLSEERSVQPLLAKIDELEQDKCRLEAELSMERSKRLMVSYPGTSSEPPSMGFSMAGSVLPCNSMERKVVTCDVSTSTDNQVLKMLSNTQQAIIQAYKIDITSCVVGDRVLIEWDRNFSNYCLVLDSSSIHVLNADCIKDLGLKPPNEASKRDRAVGEVVEKEYCYAKKNENRYRFPRGTRFFRVKVKPLTITEKVPITQSMMESSSSSNETQTIPVNTEITSSTEATAAKRSRRKTISDSMSSLNDAEVLTSSLTIPAPPPLNQRLINSINFHAHSVYHSMTHSGFDARKSQIVQFTESAVESNLEDEVDNILTSENNV